MNIRSGECTTNFLVFDFDGDGRAELCCKTADGTVDGTGRAIGDPLADWRTHDEHSPTYGKIVRGPEYLTVFEGLTGRALSTAAYIPTRYPLDGWGGIGGNGGNDSTGGRSDRFTACVAFLDGKCPSPVMVRGWYGRTVVAAWTFDGDSLRSLWTFDSSVPGLERFSGMGNHNLSVADVDGDGCDEIIYGSMAVDNDGTGLYTTGMGHGDAMHLTAFDPTTDRLQLWDCHENRRDGSDLRDAATGKVIFQIKSREDVGRCMAADIDPTNPGLEMWSSDSHGIRNIKGELVTPKRTSEEEKADKAKSEEDDTALFLRGMRLPTNFAVWWDGDLLREMLDHNRVSKYEWETGGMKLIKEFEGCTFNNGTKSNPCLSADIVGDWREEVLVRTTDSGELRLYVSPIPTDYRINCLMEDIPYRIGVATENVGYNQPPHTGFYLGPDKSVTDFLK